MPLTKEQLDAIAQEKDYYKILGVQPDATPAQAKKAYHKLSLDTHPDRNPPAMKESSEEAFKKVGAAYEVLSDPVKKQKYDNPPPPPKPEVSFVDKVVNAFKSFCDAVSKFVTSFSSKQEQKQENQGPKQ